MMKLSRKKDNKSASSGKKDGRRWLSFTICAMIGFLLFAWLRDTLYFSNVDPVYESYATFSNALDKGEIYAVFAEQQSTTIKYVYEADVLDVAIRCNDPNAASILDYPSTAWRYTNYIDCEAFKSQVLNSRTPLIQNRFTSLFKTVLMFYISLIPTLLIIYVLVLFVKMAMSQFKMGSEKHEIIKSSGIHFSDVIGHDEVIEDLMQYIKVLEKSNEVSELGVKPPRGILFTGSPGTGKTLLAKAMASEANIPFIYLNTSNVIDMFVGVGARAIRSTFKAAREQAPCIVFLDEIDAIGNKRGAVHGSSEDNQTILALLQELDGFKTKDGVLVIAATNCPERLDPALKRAGRFDREIRINPPRNSTIRAQLFQHYTKDFKLDDSVDLDALARQTSGMTGADIAVICNEAALIAILRCGDDALSRSKPREGFKIKDGKEILDLDACGNMSAGKLQSVLWSTLDANKLVELTQTDFTAAIDKLMLKGNVSKTGAMNEKDHRLIAYHEAGHTVMSYLLKKPISRITIQGTTSGVGGFVLPEEGDSQFRTREDLESQIKIAYAGRLSEIIQFGDKFATTGAANDIQMATQCTMQLLLTYGFNDTLGMLDYGVLGQANLVDNAIVLYQLRKISASLESDARQLLSKNYDKVMLLAEALLENETMTGSEVETLLSGI